MCPILMFPLTSVCIPQIGSRSSVYSPESRLRRTGSYIYEDFMPTDGTDVKVSAAGGSRSPPQGVDPVRGHCSSGTDRVQGHGSCTATAAICQYESR